MAICGVLGFGEHRACLSGSCGTPEACQGFPDGICQSIAGPSYEVVQSFLDHLGVENMVNLVVVLIVHFKKREPVGTLSGKGVWGMLFEKWDMEHGVESFGPGGRLS